MTRATLAATNRGMTMNEPMNEPINFAVLMCDQAPEIFGLISGYTEADRSLELIRLGSLAPAGCHGYVTQIEKGSRAVRLDAARQLQRAGVVFDAAIPAR